MDPAAVWALWAAVRAKAPLVQCITNLGACAAALARLQLAEAASCPHLDPPATARTASSHEHTATITKTVSMDLMANTLLAAGASPAMAHALDEVCVSVCKLPVQATGSVSLLLHVCGSVRGGWRASPAKAHALDEVCVGVCTWCYTSLHLCGSVHMIPGIWRPMKINRLG